MAKSQRATPSRPAADALGQRAVGRPPNGTREAIADAAVQEFAQEGLGGARIERISKRAETSDRMLYYHFDSKESLYLAALEKVHDDMLLAEGRINLKQLSISNSTRAIVLDRSRDIDVSGADDAPVITGTQSGHVAEDGVLSASGKLDIADLTFIPVSALHGDNVVERSAATPWYEGSTLLHHLEEVHIASDRNLIDARFPVQYVLRPHGAEFHDYRGYAGRVAGGVFRPGDEVVVLPSRRPVRSAIKWRCAGATAG